MAKSCRVESPHVAPRPWVHQDLGVRSRSARRAGVPVPSHVAQCHPPQPQLGTTKQKCLLGEIHLRELLSVSKEEARKLAGLAQARGNPRGCCGCEGQTRGLRQAQVFLTVRAKGRREVCGHTTKNAAVAGIAHGAAATDLACSNSQWGWGQREGKAEPQPGWDAPVGVRAFWGAPHTLIAPHGGKCL